MVPAAPSLAFALCVDLGLQQPALPHSPSGALEASLSSRCPRAVLGRARCLCGGGGNGSGSAAAAAGAPCRPPSPGTAWGGCCCCSASASRAGAPQVNAPSAHGLGRASLTLQPPPSASRWAGARGTGGAARELRPSKGPPCPAASHGDGAVARRGGRFSALPFLND